MSGLAGVLAGHTAPGVYRWHAAFDEADVRHTVEHAGWRFGYVDGWRAQTKAEFLAAVGETLAFPEHYGRNYDALTDCLREVATEPDSGVVLLWDGWGPFAFEDASSFALARQVLEDRTSSPASGSFVVLLRGEGPSLEGITSLD